MTFQAPILLFNTGQIAPESVDIDTAAAVLKEFGRFCTDRIAPLNASGHRAGSHCAQGVILTPARFRDANAKVVAVGWQSLCHSEEHGGQGLPRLIVAAALDQADSLLNLTF